jgi:hypothetical protein
MAIQREHIRIVIDGEWTAHNCKTFFESLDEIYSAGCYLAGGELSELYWKLFANDEHTGEDIGRMANELLRSYGGRKLPPPLQVTQLRYGSKGITDLVGIAAIIREVRKLIERLLTIDLERRKLEAELAGIVLENQKLMIRNDILKQKYESVKSKRQRARIEFIEGVSDSTVGPDLVGFVDARIHIIDEAIADGRLVGVDLVDPSADPASETLAAGEHPQRSRKIVLE